MVFIVVLLIIILFFAYLIFKPQKSRMQKSRTAKLVTLAMQTKQKPPDNLKKRIVDPKNTLIPTKLRAFRLIQREDCNQETIQHILEITQSIPRPHPLLRALTQELGDSENGAT